MLILFAQCAEPLKSPHFPSYPPALWPSLCQFWLEGDGVVNKRTGEGPGRAFSSLALDKAHKDLLKQRKNPALNKVCFATFHPVISSHFFYTDEYVQPDDTPVKEGKPGTKQQTAATSPDVQAALSPAECPQALQH